MSDSDLHAGLERDIARAVEDVPGVAFLRPGVYGRLRSDLTAGGRGRAGGRPAGVRMSRAGDGGAWQVDIHLVALAGARTVDVARAVRGAARECMAAGLSVDAVPARVTVTVTGLV
ncbi:hypothetical protein [Streptomyces sp. NPDC096152]|uniref:hypothetical protein n=1 Tax=Streptomyces sp. NPDC096152 TaxID=3366078 RepID=UPI0038037FAB